MVNEELFLLENQLCYPLYVASRLVTKCYSPILDKLEITYPQYLVLMVLWEESEVTLTFLSNKLRLQSNTLTPLLKRMEEGGMITKSRSTVDERSINITLTEKGQELKKAVPALQEQLQDNIGLNKEEAKHLHSLLSKLINNLGD